MKLVEEYAACVGYGDPFAGVTNALAVVLGGFQDFGGERLTFTSCLRARLNSCSSMAFCAA